MFEEAQPVCQSQRRRKRGLIGSKCTDGKAIATSIHIHIHIHKHLLLPCWSPKADCMRDKCRMLDYFSLQASRVIK